MTTRDLDALIAGLAPVVREYVTKSVDDATTTLNGRIQTTFVSTTELTAPLAGTVDTLTKELGTLRARLDDLEAHAATRATRPSMTFCGVWRAGSTHTPGDAVVHHRSLWVCKVATPGEPSKDFVGWQLAVRGVERKAARGAAAPEAP
jgi:hypothetical protein